MSKILYSNDSYISIDKFISYLKDYYQNIYFDTGIVDEHLIVLNYIEKTESLFDEILNSIENSIDKWYYWTILKTENKYELSKLILQIRSYTIKVIIKREKQLILIENIIF